jgi:hypothetical protein
MPLLDFRIGNLAVDNGVTVSLSPIQQDSKTVSPSVGFASFRNNLWSHKLDVLCRRWTSGVD